MPKLRTYRLFKSDFIRENYVDLNLKRNERSLLAQLRCGILPIRVETGRYIGETLEQRLCKLCSEGVIEDETHFVVKCNFYNVIRHDYLSDIISNESYARMSDSDRLVYIINTYPRRLSKYLVNAYLKRRNNLFCNR